MTVTVDNGKVKIDGYENQDPEVVAYFEFLKLQAKNLEEELDKTLKLGTLSTKAGNVGLSTDYVEKAVSRLENDFKQLFIDTFGDSGSLEKIMSNNFGENGTLMTDLLNPEKDGSPMHSVIKHVDEKIQTLRTELSVASALKQQMKKDPKKGTEFEKFCEEKLKDIAKAHGDFVENKTNLSGEVVGSKSGDHVYHVTDLSKNIVLDMKDYTSPLPGLRKILEILDTAMLNREAEFAILVSKRKSYNGKNILPAEVGMFQQYGNKLIVALTADESEDAIVEEELLEIAVKWARLRLREKQGGGIDMNAIFEKMKNVNIQMNRFTGIKTKCESIKSLAVGSPTKDGITDTLTEMETEIKGNLDEISDLLNAAVKKQSTTIT